MENLSEDFERMLERLTESPSPWVERVVRLMQERDAPLGPATNRGEKGCSGG